MAMRKPGDLALCEEPLKNSWDIVKRGDVLKLVSLPSGDSGYKFLHVKTNTELSGINIFDSGVGRYSYVRRVQWL